jgi:hypothetical protein
MEQKMKLVELNDLNIKRKLGNLFDFLWEINGKILQSMGCESFEEIYFRKQRLVQMFLEFFFL